MALTEGNIADLVSALLSVNKYPLERAVALMPAIASCRLDTLPLAVSRGDMESFSATVTKVHGFGPRVALYPRDSTAGHGQDVGLHIADVRPGLREALRATEGGVGPSAGAGAPRRTLVRTRCTFISHQQMRSKRQAASSVASS